VLRSNQLRILLAAPGYVLIERLQPKPGKGALRANGI
jgi:hypothetical protein